MLFIPWNDTYEPRSLKELWNFGHVLLFAFATVLLSASWQWFRDRTFAGQIIILVILSLLVGMAIEVIQLHTGGDFSLHDVYLDVTGACLVPAIRPQCRYRPAQYSLWLLRLVVILYLLVRAFPVAISLEDEYQARRDFPVLAGFQSKLELGRFAGGSRRKLTDAGLQVDFSTKRYSGFSLKYFPGDWSGYHMLNIDIRNPGSENVYLTCRIHDEHHNQAYSDRYNRRFNITPGDQTIQIDLEQVRTAPSTRTMDMKKIGGLGCFTVSRAAPAQLIIRKIYLK